MREISITRKLIFYKEILRKLIDLTARLLTDKCLDFKVSEVINKLPSFPVLASYDTNLDTPFKKILNYVDNFLFWLLFTREKLLLKGKLKTDALSNFLDEFSGYREQIYEKVVKEVSARYRKNILLSVYNGVEKLLLMVTHRCQLRCKYCRAKKFDADMSREVLYKSLDFLKNSLRKSTQIHFFGGEPLLMYPLVVEGVNYAKAIFKDTPKNINFFLTTNALLLDRRKIDFFRRNRFFIEASFEGDAQMQLTNRKGFNADYSVYNKILNNIKFLTQANVDYRVITVIMPKDVDKMFEVFIKLVEMGIKNIQINYALEVIWNSRKLEKLLQEYRKIFDYVEKHKDINFVNFSSFRQEPVILNRELAVDYDGMLFFETGFHLKNAKFNIAPLDNVKCIDIYSPTPFLNFYMLVKNYGNSKFLRKVILNNLEIGFKVRQHFNNENTCSSF